MNRRAKYKVTFEDHWNRLERRNEKLRCIGGKMSISIESFRIELEKAYEVGKQDGVAMSKKTVEAARAFEKAGRPLPPFSDLFSGLFR